MPSSGSAIATGAASSPVGSRNAYPGASDLLAYFEAHNLTAEAALQAMFASTVLAARKDLEKATGRRFLAVEESRTFDPPTTATGTLDLKADLASLTSLTLSGIVLTRNSDFRLLPQNAAADGVPYTLVKFNRRWFPPLDGSLWGAIEIEGAWGYGTELPEDVWNAILAGAACKLYSHVAQASTGGLLGWSDADRTVQYGVETWNRLNTSWSAVYDAAVQHYKRVTAGL